MQTSKLKADEHYAVNRSTGIDRFRMVEVEEKHRLVGSRNWIRMIQVHSATGEELRSDPVIYSIAPKDILAPWVEYQEEYARKQADVNARQAIRLGREQLTRDLLTLYGFDPAQM